MAWTLRLLLVALLVLAANAAWAQDKPLRGVALVIGESVYTGTELPALTNPKKDARAIDELLGNLGFDVTRVLDGNGKKLQSAIDAFVEDAKDADVALIYYSGHGIEADGENYIAPTDADLSTPQQAGATLIPVSPLLDKLAQAVPVTIVLLDACRTGAFPAGTMIQPPGASAPVPAVENGLAVVRGPTPFGHKDTPDTSLGMVIGFAASPGEPALDGDPGDDNSPYAAALIKHLGAGGYSFGDVMTMVGEEVYLKTKAQQMPWVNSSLRRVLNFGAAAEDTDPDEAAIKTGRRQLLLSIAAEPAATRGTVEAIASTQGVPLDALYGMLKVLGVDTSGGSADLEQQLEQGAKQLKQFKEQELGTAASDPELKRLSDLAVRAQDEGAMDLALRYREQATARARALSAERDTLEASLAADRIEIARTFADHAQTATLNFDYRTAAQMFGEAYGQVAKWDDGLALTYKRDQAEALRDDGDFRLDNDALKQSIATFKEALLLAPRETHLDAWIDIETNLGWALETLGERQSDTAALNEAVDVLQAAIEATPPGTPAADLAVSKLNLANAVSLLGQRDTDSARMQKAVAIYQEALSGLSPDADAYIWGKLQYNLGATLRVIGERASGNDTLQQAIGAFEASLTKITRELSPLEWALAQNNYGTALFQLAARTHDVGLYDRAADAFNSSLEENTERRAPLDWAMAQANLGSVYFGLNALTGDPQALQQSIGALRASLKYITPQTVPLFYATAQSNMGAALTALSEQTHDTGPLNDAVTAFNAALAVRTEQNDPSNWAMTEFNLSGTLAELGTGEASPAHLQQAVDAAHAALRQWSKQNEPFFWAKANYALGNALSLLADKETGTDSIVQSIAAFQAALTVFDKTAQPAEWLQTTKKYAFSLQQMGERLGAADYTSKAVTAYRDALTLTSAETEPAEFGRLNFNLGLCLLNLDAYGALPDGFEQAAVAFRTSLQGYPRDTDPADWADTQYRLGYVLHSAANKLPSGGVDELKDAIAAYRAAQEIKTKESDPFGWAEIETLLASADGLLGVRTGDKAAVQAGRDAMVAAWDVYKTRDHSYDDDFESRIKVFDQALASLD